jgi:hypothetical protein
MVFVEALWMSLAFVCGALSSAYNADLRTFFYTAEDVSRLLARACLLRTRQKFDAFMFEFSRGNHGKCNQQTLTALNEDADVFTTDFVLPPRRRQAIVGPNAETIETIETAAIAEQIASNDSSDSSDSKTVSACKLVSL